MVGDWMLKCPGCIEEGRDVEYSCNHFVSAAPYDDTCCERPAIDLLFSCEMGHNWLLRFTNHEGPTYGSYVVVPWAEEVNGRGGVL